MNTWPSSNNELELGKPRPNLSDVGGLTNVKWPQTNEQPTAETTERLSTTLVSNLSIVLSGQPGHEPAYSNLQFLYINYYKLHFIPSISS